MLTHKEERKHQLSVIASEVEDRVRRSTNFIISGVPEPTSTSPEEEDDEKCADILMAIGLNDNNDVKEVCRIGKRKEDSDTRLLKVKCSDIDFRNCVLRKAKDLRKTSDFKSVYINSNLTRFQQMTRRELLEKLKKRITEGENVVIFRDRIVQRTNKQNFIARF